MCIMELQWISVDWTTWFLPLCLFGSRGNRNVWYWLTEERCNQDITLILRNKATALYSGEKAAVFGTRLKQWLQHPFSAKVSFIPSIFILTSARLHSNNLRIPIPILSISSENSNWDLFLELRGRIEQRKSGKNWWGRREINMHPPGGKVLN